LTTVNQELKIKIEELSLTSNNLKNLINSTDIGTIFLDGSFRVELFTPAARQIFNLLPADLGRPLSDITNRLADDGILGDAETVLEKLSPVERQVRTTEDRVYLMRILPYRTTDDRIQGTVATFFDITERKRAEEALRVNEERTRGQKEAFQAAINGAALEDSLKILARVVTEETGGEARTAFYIADPEGARLHTIRGAGDMPESYANRVDGFLIGEDSLACGLAIPTGRPVLTRDVFEEPLWKPWLQMAEEYDFRGCWSFPIKTRDSKGIGTFAMYFRAAREATPRDLALADIITRSAAVIISSHTEAQKRARAEEDLRQSEERFHAVANNMSQLAWICDKLGNVTWYNQRWLDYTGLSYEAMKGWDWSKVQHPDHLDRVVARVKHSAETGEPWEDTFPLRGKDGSYRWFLSRAVPIRDGSGEVVRWFGTNTDITERKQTEALHLIQKQTFEMAASGAPLMEVLEALAAGVEKHADAQPMVAIHLLDESGLRFERTAGVALPGGYVEAVDGMPVLSMTGPCCAAIARHQRVAVADVASDSEFPKFAAFALPAGIRAGWSTPIISSFGKVLGTVAHYYRQPRQLSEQDDALAEIVTRTAAMVIERARVQQALRESEDRFRLVADNAPVLIWQTGESGVAFVNRHYLDFFGVPFEAVAGMGWAGFLHPDDTAGYLAAYRAAFGRQERYEHPCRLRRHDGEYRWFQNVGMPHFGPDGAFVGFIGCSLDVTDSKRAAEGLAEVDRKKDEFLATLAHELRNPLAPLPNGLQLMKLAKNDGDAIEQARSMMERQLGQMIRLIDDLMDLTRISRGKVVLQKTRMPLAAAVRNAVDSSRPLVEAAGQELTLDVPGEAIYVDADEVRLSQVITNLLNNAAKYTEKGGRIRLAVERQGSDAVLTVEDNGVGIPAPMLPRVFDMFTQADCSLERAQGGLGIGLTIVRQLVEMHGGSIEARSGGHGMGSTFVVRLPEVPAPAEPHRDADAGAKPAASRRILVADDNADSASSLAMILKIMGNEVRTANDGVQAVETAAVFRPDVILLDIGMPKLNGYAAARRIP
jgi:PAS domain S-box-containing protein